MICGTKKKKNIDLKKDCVNLQIPLKNEIYPNNNNIKYKIII